MLPKIAILLLILASIAVSETSLGAPFTYAGFGLEADWQSLPARFPRSTHEFWESQSGTIHLLAADGRAKFQQALSAEPGKYRVRLSESEAVIGVYYLEFEMAAGKIQGLKLSFEKPEQFLKAGLTYQDQRFPACGPILSSLITQYGKPEKVRSWTEEALDHSVRTWRSGSEQLSLDCGQYMGRKKVFALELTISR